MPVPNQTPYIIYNANGLTTVFSFEFYIINAGDIQVSINGTTVTSGYSVSGIGNVGGGDVTFITPPASGSVVMLERVVPTYRLTDYQDNGDLLADTVNKDFDRLWMAIQRSFIYLGLALRRPLLGGPFNAEGYRIANLADPINDQDAATKKYVNQVGQTNLNRALRVPEGYVNPLPAAAERRNKLLGCDDAGNPVFVMPPSGSASDVLLDLAKQGSDKKIGSSYGATVWADYERGEFQRKGYFAVGGLVENNRQVMQDEDGLWWFYTGTYPYAVSPGVDPYDDPLWYCAGLLNGKEISDLSSWCDTVSNVDVTFEMQQFFRTLAYLKRKAVCYGAIKLTSGINTYDVPWDMSKLIVTLDASSVDSVITGSGGYIFLVKDPATIEGTGFNASITEIGQISSSALNTFGFSTFGYEAETSADNAYLRGGSGIIRKSDILINDSGNFRATPSLYGLTGTVKYATRPIRPQEEYLSPKIILTGTFSSSLTIRSVVRVECNNRTFIGGVVDARSESIFLQAFYESNKVAFINVFDCHWRNSFVLSDYLVNAFATYGLNIQRCSALFGWGLVDGNFMRDTVVSDCVTGAKMGCHAMAWNFTAQRIKFQGITDNINGGYSKGGIHITGGGTLIVRDCDVFYAGGQYNTENLVQTRDDYGQGWEGDILVENIRITYQLKNASNSPYALVCMQAGVSGSLDYTRSKLYLGKKITIRNVKLYRGTIAYGAENILFAPLYFNVGGSMTTRYPDEVVMEDITQESIIGGWNLQLRFPGIMASSYLDASRCKWTLRRVNLTLPPGVNTFFINPTISDLSASKITNEVIFEDCAGTINGTLAGTLLDSWTIRRCQVGAISLDTVATSAMTFRMDACSISGNKCGGSIGVERAYYTNNNITSLSATVGARSVYCNGNTLPPSGSITGRTVGEWWDYRDPSVFRVT
ncbi:phage tail fiber protein [Enterobacter hormaechei]|uniref:phage tail fiber domain-containing protein n=1 Tax=Enterobacter hormaechei TaxID=158836 RepID=UPI00067FFDBC|nr:phage tail fiber protein [Enterobacter hormaechei]